MSEILSPYLDDKFEGEVDKELKIWWANEIPEWIFID